MTSTNVGWDVGWTMKKLHRLTDRKVKTTLPGKYHDGAGLYLIAIMNSEGVINRNWSLRYGIGGGKHRYCGLGSYPLVSLADAREKAEDARKLLTKGIDPIAHKAAVRASLSQQEATTEAKTFRECAKAYIAAHEAGWRGKRETKRWSNSLEAYAYPVIGDKDVATASTEDMLKILSPIWTTKPETALQVRGRIERIFDWAKVQKFRDGSNPAMWRGHLAHLLPKVSRRRRVKHHPALPYKELPAFMVELRELEEMPARCLEFLILTASRTAEAVLAVWTEIDLEKRVWVIPAGWDVEPGRTHADREHRVPLSDAAVDLLRRLPRINEYVFPGDYNAHMCLSILRLLMKRMERTGITGHGFRSSFRDWAGNETYFAREIAEAALGHVIGDEAEQAYWRSDALERRRQLMQAWADYCTQTPGANVIPLRAASGQQAL